MLEEPNYVCMNGGRYCGRDDKGKLIEQFISRGNKVYLEFNFGFVNIDYENSCEMRPHYINSNIPNVEKFCRCVIDDDRGTVIYLKQENILNSFRPIVHKHPAAKLCEDVDKLNEFLKTLPINSLRDVKDCKKSWLVIYIDNGDDN